MIMAFIRCEVCRAIYEIDPYQRPYEWDVPAPWILLTEGNPPTVTNSRSFCSRDCLATWLGMTTVAIAQPQVPQSKMRRFILVDGETADEFEGVLFNTGHVSVDFDARHFPMHFKGWDHLKEMNPGSGVTWIDQEVSDATR